MIKLDDFADVYALPFNVAMQAAIAIDGEKALRNHEEFSSLPAEEYHSRTYEEKELVEELLKQTNMAIRAVELRLSLLEKRRDRVTTIWNGE